MYFHFYKKIMSRIIAGIHSSNLFHRGRNEHYYILRRDHKQNNQHKMWHIQGQPNIKAAPCVFMAKHLEYFKMEIQVCPLENVDERILAGNQSAYQIDGAAGSCCWIRFGMTSWTLGDQHSAGEKRGTTGGQMGMGTGSGNGTEGKSKQGIKNFRKSDELSWSRRKLGLDLEQKLWKTK